VHRAVRFAVGATVGLLALALAVTVGGTDAVLDHASAVTWWTVLAVVTLVAAEAVVDGLGVWASVRPLGSGLSGRASVKFALAGDFFDTVNPAGPVGSEPVVARFVAVETGTDYASALGVRSVAKYVKSGAQLLASVVFGAAVLVGRGSPTVLDGGSTATAARSVSTTPSVTAVLGAFLLAVVGLVVVAVLAVRSRALLSTVAVAVLAPLARLVARLRRREPPERAAVRRATAQFWERALSFRDRPGLVAAIALAGVAEQTLTAAALWVALVGTGTAAPLVPLAAVVPLPQIASLVPVPGSIGAYDLLLVGALVAAVAVPAAAATAAVVLVRAAALPFALAVGGVAVAFLRGWRPHDATRQ
jgi:uncharacterized membrane protein YbhN (UPF0104 family)